MEQFLIRYGDILNNFFSKKHVFIASFPKSASTFLFNFLCEMTGYEKKLFIKGFDQTEQDVYLPQLINCLSKNSITYQHARATTSNVETLEKFGIKPIVLTRDLVSCIKSLHTHMENEPGNVWWPMAYINKDYYSISEKEKINLLIDCFCPWYINFYISWYNVKINNPDFVLWLDHSDIFRENISETLGEIFKFNGISGVDISPQRINKIYDSTLKVSRFNKERTKVEITGSQIDSIRKYLNYYKSVDFKSII